MTSTIPAPWETVDPTLVNPRAVRLVEAFKGALARMRDEHGLTSTTSPSTAVRP